MSTQAENRKLMMIAKAMRDPDHWVLGVDYVDNAGNRTQRKISPIRFAFERSLVALCLGRGEPRTFKLERLSNVHMVSADDVLMPEPIVTSSKEEVA